MPPGRAGFAASPAAQPNGRGEWGAAEEGDEDEPLMAPAPVTSPGPLGRNLAPTNSATQINGRGLSTAEVQALSAAVGGQVPAGAFWYDPGSGLWGPMGGGSVGQILPGLPLGRPPAGCSGRGSNIRINGREISFQEVQFLTGLLGPIQPGRYFLDAAGNAGLEGGPVLVNLFAASRRGGARGGAAGSFFQQSATGSIHGYTDGNGDGMITVRDSSGKAIDWSP